MNSSGVYSHVLRAAQILFEPSQVVELRTIFKNGRIDSGYFDDFSLMAEAATELDRRADASGIYESEEREAIRNEGKLCRDRD
jgi:hypothetical protein